MVRCSMRRSETRRATVTQALAPTIMRAKIWAWGETERGKVKCVCRRPPTPRSVQQIVAPALEEARRVAHLSSRVADPHCSVACAVPMPTLDEVPIVDQRKSFTYVRRVCVQSPGEINGVQQMQMWMRPLNQTRRLPSEHQIERYTETQGAAESVLQPAATGGEEK